MKKDIQKSIEIYKEQLDNGYIQVAYLALTKYVAELKSNFPKEYRTGNISLSAGWQSGQCAGDATA